MIAQVNVAARLAACTAPTDALCSLLHVREHVWVLHPGHVYFAAAVHIQHVPRRRRLRVVVRGGAVVLVTPSSAAGCATLAHPVAGRDCLRGTRPVPSFIKSNSSSFTSSIVCGSSCPGFWYGRGSCVVSTARSTKPKCNDEVGLEYLTYVVCPGSFCCAAACCATRQRLVGTNRAWGGAAWLCCCTMH